MYKILEKELGLSYSGYRKKWKSSGKGEINLKYPLHINFELNFGCNLKCEFCTYSMDIKKWKYKIEPKKKISFEKYCEIIDEGVIHGLCSVCLNGNNEPLLKKDICKYIDYAIEKGILEVSLHTNGLLLDRKKTEKILNSKLTTIMFSIDAFNERTYKETRNGDYCLLLKNINYFIEQKNKLKKKFPLTRVSFFKNKINIKELDDFRNYWKDKVDCIEIQSFCNLFMGTNKLRKINKRYYLENSLFENCFEPYRRLSIQNNGNVFPCCSTYGNEVVVGNIYNNSIYNIWNNDKMKKMRMEVENNIFDNHPKGCIKCKKSGLKISIK